MSGGNFTLCSKSVDRKYQRDCQDVKPADYPETVHECQEQALMQQLLIDKAQGRGTGISSCEAILDQLCGQGMGALLDSLRSRIKS